MGDTIPQDKKCEERPVQQAPTNYNSYPQGTSASNSNQSAPPSYVVQPNYGPQQTQQYVTPSQVVYPQQCATAPVIYPAQIAVTSIKASEKSIVDAYILWFVLGLGGAHHLYLRRPWFFIAYMCTFGLLGVGWLVDMFRLPCLVKEANVKYRNPERNQRKKKVDAYVLWFPFGLLGFHLFYLRRPGQGLLYFFTLGLFGIGWIVDLFRIPHMVNDCNDYPDGHPNEEKSMFASYILCVSPLGILGAHHYYLNRPYWGLLYTFTFGLMGVGWVVDWIRCFNLVRRSREIQKKTRDQDIRYMDDIYVLWFPLGWLGFHHFYLRRYVWGFLYFFTLGLMGVGWLIDFCRLPCLLKEFNQQLIESKNLTKTTHDRLGNGHVETGSSGTRQNQIEVVVTHPQQTVMYGSTLSQGVAVGPNIAHMANTTIPHQVYPAQVMYMPPHQGYHPGYFPYQQPQQPQPQPFTGIPSNAMSPEQPPSYDEATETKS